tara:strand:+ start:2408 stop:3148 length:741 start_codon:yes stop_codon:yes gene_type:complete
MTVGIIVQARMGSTRLPGKIMINADEKHIMLDYSINQLKNCQYADKIIIATSILERDNVIEEYCKKIGVDVFRGSEKNVLDRHYQCAKKFSLSKVLRIPSDKPLIDPQIVDSVIQNFVSDEFDYIANFQVTEENGTLVHRTSYPSGTEVEMMSFKTLEKAWKEATTLDEKEHVTPYIYLNPQKFKVKILDLEKDLSEYRWSLDYQNDVIVIKEIIKNIEKRPVLMKDIIEFLKRNPNIAKINTMDD